MSTQTKTSKTDQTIIAMQTSIGSKSIKIFQDHCYLKGEERIKHFGYIKLNKNKINFTCFLLFPSSIKQFYITSVPSIIFLLEIVLLRSPWASVSCFRKQRSQVLFVS